MVELSHDAVDGPLGRSTERAYAYNIGERPTPLSPSTFTILPQSSSSSSSTTPSQAATATHNVVKPLTS
jgi:hypothetical protein